MTQREGSLVHQDTLREYQGSLYSALDTKFAQRANAIVCSLIFAILEDLRQHRGVGNIVFEDIGWRNKYNIHLLSGLSQKIIYREEGIIERLMNLNILKVKDAPTNWGQQKYHYRISDNFIWDWLFMEV